MLECHEGISPQKKPGSLWRYPVFLIVRQIFSLPSLRSRYPGWPFLEAYAPKDEKALPCVKKSACLSEASFADFSKVAFFQVCWKNRPRIFGYFCFNDKSNKSFSSSLHSCPQLFKRPLKHFSMVFILKKALAGRELAFKS